MFLAFGPYGSVRLGKDDEEPEFSTVSWISMLFAGGMGAGLLFWGAAEPLYHYNLPPGLEGKSPQAARLAMVLTNMHWGLHAWSIYAVCALVIAYSWNIHEPLTAIADLTPYAQFGLIARFTVLVNTPASGSRRQPAPLTQHRQFRWRIRE